jgi:hypothetical protein
VTRTFRLSDPRLACDRLLSQAEAKFGPEVALGSLPVDEYWSFDARTAFTLADDPHLQMGTVSDDLESLGEFLTRRDGESCPGVLAMATTKCSQQKRAARSLPIAIKSGPWQRGIRAELWACGRRKPVVLAAGSE